MGLDGGNDPNTERRMTDRAAGMLGPDDLTAEAFDTIVVAAPDVQGRLFGRRIPLRKFLAAGGLDAYRLPICTCVLAWDITQDLGAEVPFAGFHTGWHDFILHPDPATLRPYPGAPRTAVVMADVHTEHGEPSKGGAPLDPPPPGRTRARRGLRGASVRAGVLPVRRAYRQARARNSACAGPDHGDPLRLLDRGARRAGAVHRAHPRHDGRRRHPDRCVPGRVRVRAMGGQPRTRAGAGDRGPARAVQVRREGTGVPGGVVGDVHGEAERRGHGFVVSPARVAGVAGDGRARVRVRAGSG